jgi:transposase-like protein
MNGETLLGYLRAHSLDTGFLRDALHLAAEWAIEQEVSAAIEAAPYERRQGRRAYRNGYRARSWQTTLGEIELRIPKLRKGAYYPRLMDELPRLEAALLALVQDAYLQGVKVEDAEKLLRGLGLPVRQGQAADLCAQLDDLAEAFRARPVSGYYPALQLDVLRLDSLRRSVIAAVGEGDDGFRELLSLEIAPCHLERGFWAGFFRRLEARGLRRFDTLIGDEHDGLKLALRESFARVDWKRRSYQPAPDDTPALVPAISTLFLQVEHARLFSPESTLAGALLHPVDEEAAEMLLRLRQAFASRADAVSLDYHLQAA